MAEYDDDIKKILSVCHQPITVQEITEFLDAANSRPIRDRVNNMVDDNLLQKFAGSQSKAFSVMLQEGSSGKVEIKVQHIRTVDSVHQFVGRVDLFDIPKFCGIHPYRQDVSIGVQRARQSAWTKKLSNVLDSKMSLMLNSMSIYLDKTNMVSDEPDKIEKSSTLFIPYKSYCNDDQKPAWLIDGQQRMWAIQRIAIRGAMGEIVNAPIPYYAPITILVGEFDKNSVTKMQTLSSWFVNANSTKNLPSNLIHELEARMLDSGMSGDELSKPEKAGDAQVKIWLNDSNTSPFEGLIKSESNLEGFVSEGSIMSIIKHTRENILLKKDSIDRTNLELIYNFLEDYYWAVRVVWQEDWIKPVPSLTRINSKLLAPVGIGSLAFMMEHIVPLEFRFELNRSKRTKEFIRRLMRVKDDINWDVKDYQNNKGDIQRFVKEKFLPTYTMQVNTRVPEDELEELYSLLPDKFREIIEGSGE